MLKTMRQIDVVSRDLYPAPLNPESGLAAFPPRVLRHIGVLVCDMELAL